MVTTVRNYGSSAHAQVEYRGQTKSLVEWAKSLNLDYSVIRMRYKRGKTGDDLFHPTPASFLQKNHNGTWRDATKPSLKDKRIANTPPAVFYELSPEVRVEVLRHCNGGRDDVTRLIDIALRHYFDLGRGA